MEWLQKKTPAVTTDKARFMFCKISSLYSYFLRNHRSQPTELTAEVSGLGDLEFADTNESGIEGDLAFRGAT